MNRYIDADALTRMIEAKADTLIEGKEAFLYVAKWLEFLPSADVVEVRWKPIIGFEGLYEVSTLGQVRNKNGLFMKQYLKRDKYTVYKKVALWKDGKYKHFYVHRLVAEAFVPNPDNLPIVNHKDEDGTNNFPNNLEWCDKSYNARYGKSLERIKKAARKRKPTEEQKAKMFNTSNVTTMYGMFGGCRSLNTLSINS